MNMSVQSTTKKSSSENQVENVQDSSNFTTTQNQNREDPSDFNRVTSQLYNQLNHRHLNRENSFTLKYNKSGNSRRSITDRYDQAEQSSSEIMNNLNKQMTESDCEYDDDGENFSQDSPTESNKTCLVQESSSREREQNEMVFKKHIMKKFSNFKRLINENHHQSHENLENNHSESECSQQKKARKHDENTEDRMNRENDSSKIDDSEFSYLNHFNNKSSSEQDDLALTKRDLTKSNSSRSSCSSNTSQSSGIGSSSGRLSSEQSSENQYGPGETNKADEIIVLFTQKKENDQSISSTTSSINGAMVEKDQNTSTGLDCCDTNSDDNDIDQNIDLNSNYDAENEDEIDLGVNSGSEDEHIDSEAAKAIQQMTKQSAIRKSKRMLDRRNTASLQKSDSKDDNSLNNLLRTMNEILTSQLILTRKIDCVNENFVVVDKRLKDIEYYHKKAFKKHPLQSSALQFKRIATNCMDSSAATHRKQMLSSSSSSNASIPAESNPFKKYLVKQEQISELNGTEGKLSSKVESTTQNDKHKSLILSSYSSSNKSSKDQDLSLSRSHNNSSDKSPSYFNNCKYKISATSQEQTNKTNSAAITNDHTSSNSNAAKNHILSISNLTENRSKTQSMNTFIQQHEHIYKSLSQQLGNNKHLDHKSFPMIAKCVSAPLGCNNNQISSHSSKTPDLFNGTSCMSKSNRFALADQSVKLSASSVSGNNSYSSSSSSSNNKITSFIEQQQSNNPHHLMHQMSFNSANLSNNDSYNNSSISNNHSSVSNKLSSNCFSGGPSYQFHHPSFQHQIRSQSQMSHLAHSQGSHSSFGLPYQGSTSSPSNLLMTSTNNKNNSTSSTSGNNNCNSKENSSASRNQLALALSASSTSSIGSRSHQQHMSHEFQGGKDSENMIPGNIGDGYSNFENEENDYDLVEEDNDASFHQSNQQRETMEQAANFIVQQHGLIRHVPSGSVDQLELDEESELLVSRDVIKRCVRKAKHRGNFAANLAAELFSKEERVSCNCTGTRGKRQLSPRRLNLVKDITFRMYNTSPAVLAATSSNNVSTAAVASAAMNAAYHDFEEAWRKECITAIDAKNRSIGRDLIKTAYNSSGESKLQKHDSSISMNHIDNNTMSPGPISTPFSNSGSINTTEINEN